MSMFEINNWALKKVIFFISRVIFFGCALVLPLYFEKLHSLHKIYGYLLVVSYFIFITMNWYVWGKEINYRFKVYARANSSVDRILERILLGSVVSIFILSCISMFSRFDESVLYWGFWSLAALFFSYPTKRRIIDRKISFEFSELKFMDGFEKVIFGIIIIVFLVSVPNFPIFHGTDAIKVYLDPGELIHDQLWAFYDLILFHGKEITGSNNFSYFYFTYLLFFGFFVLSFYCILRFKFTRKVALIGTLSIVCTRYLYYLLFNHVSDLLTTAIMMILCWVFLWSLKSSTYRSGLLMGLIGYFCLLVNIKMLLLHAALTIVFLIYKFKESSFWFLKQFIRYTLVGATLTILTLLLHHGFQVSINILNFYEFIDQFKIIFTSKSFFILAIPGILILFFDLISKKDFELFKIFIFLVLAIIWGLIFEIGAVRSFFIVALISFVCMLTLDKILSKVSINKSHQNLIILFYVVMCMMDSSIEYRVKSLLGLL